MRFLRATGKNYHPPVTFEHFPSQEIIVSRNFFVDRWVKSSEIYNWKKKMESESNENLYEYFLTMRENSKVELRFKRL